MKKVYALGLMTLLLATISFTTIKSNPGHPNPTKRILASQPPMGWNSWDCLGWTATEEQVKANADYMSEHLKHLGYEYIVIDANWFADSLGSSFDAFVKETIPVEPQYTLDAYGRLLPDTLKFPSSKNGKGFKPLADYIHSKGLKFGVHLQRGIPWEAAQKNMPIKGTEYGAKAIGEPSRACDWYDGFYGVNMNHPGGQAYYDSVFELLAEWGVDYVKADDIVYESEFLGISKAARDSGRDILLSVVPANIPWETLKEHSDMARTGYDYWDVWQMLKQAFGEANKYAKYRGDGFWPDLDMLPVGKIGMEISYKGPHERISNFTKDELHTLLSLWYISHSPLMIGGYLPDTDPITYELLTNEEALEASTNTINNRQIKYKNAMVIWAADSKDTDDKYLAMFNMWETFFPLDIKVTFDQLGLSIDEEYEVRDLWAKKDIGTFKGSFSRPIIMHGAGLYKISKKK